MVGDTSMDMRSARRAGALAVGVLSGFGTRREMVRGGAQIILETAAELLPLLSAEAASD
jgi:phosphoglycolate phosphatase